MKILFAVSSLSSGGAERVATTLTNAWIKRGFQVTLIPTFSGKGICFYDIDPKVNIVYLADRVLTKKKSPLSQLRRLIVLRKLIINDKPDIIISFLSNVNVAILLASINLNIPVIACERNDFIKSTHSTLLKIQCFITYRLAAVISVQTPDAIEYFKAYRSVRIMPNPIPPDLPLQKALSHLQDQKNNYTLVAVGRLTQQKQFDHLISAFKALAHKFPFWNLVIYGEGPERKRLETIIRESNLQGRIQLPGRTNNLWEEMTKADLFVLTSLYEGFPNVLLEAMALGLPCISTDCPNGPRQISNNGKDAILVPVKDKDSLIGAIESLMKDHQGRINLGMNASRSVNERYCLENVLQIWDNTFKEVFSGRIDNAQSSKKR